MKNIQKGFIVPLIIIILAVLAIGGGVYAYHEKKVNDQIIASSTAEAMATTSMNQTVTNTQTQTNTTVTSNTNVSVSTNTTLTDAAIAYAINPKLTLTANGYEFKSTTYGTTEGITILARGDVNGDGYEDALVDDNHCGGSCGDDLIVVLNNKNGTGTVVKNSTFSDYIPDSAAETGIQSASIKNGIISLTGQGFEGQVDPNQTITKQYKYTGNGIVEISSNNQASIQSTLSSYQVVKPYIYIYGKGLTAVKMYYGQTGTNVGGPLFLRDAQLTSTASDGTQTWVIDSSQNSFKCMLASGYFIYGYGTNNAQVGTLSISDALSTELYADSTESCG